jgi:hypothetical protein
MSIRATLSTLPYKLKADYEKSVYEQYMATLLRITTENTANAVTALSQGQIGASYIEVDYIDIINPKPVDNRSADEIISNIKEKVNKMKQ